MICRYTGTQLFRLIGNNTTNQDTNFSRQVARNINSNAARQSAHSCILAIQDLYNNELDVEPTTWKEDMMPRNPHLDGQAAD